MKNGHATSFFISLHKCNTLTTESDRNMTTAVYIFAAYILAFCAILYAAFTVFRIIAFCFGYIRKSVNDGSIGKAKDKAKGKVAEEKALGIDQRGILNSHAYYLTCN